MKPSFSNSPRPQLPPNLQLPHSCFWPLRNPHVFNHFHTLQKTTRGIPLSQSKLEDQNETAALKPSVSHHLPSSLPIRQALSLCSRPRQLILHPSHRLRLRRHTRRGPLSSLRPGPSEL